MGLGAGASPGGLLSFRDFVLVRNGNSTFLKALLSTATLAGLVPDLIDRGWVVFARVDSFAVSIRGNEAIVTGELKLSAPAANWFNWMLEPVNAGVAGFEIGKLKSTISFG
jgi:hypothetical protein